MDIQNTIDYYLKSAWHGITRMYNQIALEYDSTQTTGYVLINIAKEGTFVTKIAPLMGMEPTSLSRVLKKMEDKGLIYREPDLQDKRAVKIFLTPEGVAKRKIAKAVIVEFNEYLMKSVSKEDIANYQRISQEINNVAKEFINNKKNCKN